tara:strand:- start:146 stop:883 length:738 start_codon:yes stop_codon:yes gene_type:complete
MKRLKRKKLKHTTWVIIPARGGSKGLKNKNIKNFLGIPLIYHSINFAKKLKNIDKIFVSTDSKKIRKIAQKKNVFIPFLRGKKASGDFAMEEDILEDIKKKLLIKKINLPDSILWLRPTHPFRDVKVFQKALKLHQRLKKSVLITTPAEARIFIKKSKYLIPINNLFLKKSMVRRQEVKLAYKIFHGEFFIFPKKYNKKFLGSNLLSMPLPSQCSLDIDTIEDIKNGEAMFSVNSKKIRKYVHLS